MQFRARVRFVNPAPTARRGWRGRPRAELGRCALTDVERDHRRSRELRVMAQEERRERRLQRVHSRGFGIANAVERTRRRVGVAGWEVREHGPGRSPTTRSNSAPSSSNETMIGCFDASTHFGENGRRGLRVNGCCVVFTPSRDCHVGKYPGSCQSAGPALRNDA